VIEKQLKGSLVEKKKEERVKEKETGKLG